MVADPLPRNVNKHPWDQLTAHWMIAVSLKEGGRASASVGKLNMASKRMTFEQLPDHSWTGPVEAAMANLLVAAACEVKGDVDSQLMLW